MYSTLRTSTLYEPKQLMLRMVGYGRVSTNKEEQQSSLAAQKEFFAEYAQRYGHKLVGVYADEGISGTQVKKRAEFKRLMEDAKYGLFDVVVVKDVSRFARNTVDLLQNVRELKSLGIEVVFVSADMRSMGDSEFVLTIFGAAAQEESANLSKRVKFGKQITGQRGRVPNFVYGYDHIDNVTLQINEEEAKIVRRIFDMYTEEGFGARAISKELNDRGIVTKKGYPWNSTNVRRLLDNSIYCGDYYNHKYEVKDYLTHQLKKVDEKDWMYHSRPEWAIITREQFEKALRVREKRRIQYKNETPGHRYSNRHLFSSLLYCAHCGYAFSFRKEKTQKGESHFYRCSTNNCRTDKTCDNSSRIKEEVLLNAVRDYLVNSIKSKEEFVDTAVRAAMASQRKAPTKRDKSELEKIERTLLKKKERLQDMYINELISIQDLKKRLEPIDAELEEIAIEMQEKVVAEIKEDELAERAKAYRAQVEAFLKMENITNVDLQKVIERIEFSKDKHITVKLKDLSENYD